MIIFLFFLLPLLLSTLIDIKIFFLILVINFSIFYIVSILLSRYNLNDKYIYLFIYIYTSLISCFSILSYHHSAYLFGNELQPYMPGGDAESYYFLGKYLSNNFNYDSIKEISFNYLGYPIFLGFIFNIFGDNLFIGLAFNYLFIILSITLLSISTFRLTRNIHISRNVVLISIFLPQLFSIPILLLKDSLIIFVFSLFLHSTVSLFIKRKKIFRSVLILAFCILMIASLRLPYLIFLFFVVFLSLRKIRIIEVLGLLFISIFTINIFSTLSGLSTHNFNFNFIINNIFSSNILFSQLGDIQSKSSGIMSILGSYSNWSLPTKFLFIPFTTMIQFITPFDFWNFRFLNNHIFYFGTQLHMFWTFGTGILLLFTIIRINLIENDIIKKMFILGVFSYCFIAFINGGVVPRYSLPFFVFMIPGISTVLTLYIQNNFEVLISFYLKIYLFYFLLAAGYLILKFI